MVAVSHNAPRMKREVVLLASKHMKVVGPAASGAWRKPLRSIQDWFCVQRELGVESWP